MTKKGTTVVGLSLVNFCGAKLECSVQGMCQGELYPRVTEVLHSYTQWIERNSEGQFGTSWAGSGFSYLFFSLILLRCLSVSGKVVGWSFLRSTSFWGLSLLHQLLWSNYDTEDLVELKLLCWIVVINLMVIRPYLLSACFHRFGLVIVFSHFLYYLKSVWSFLDAWPKLSQRVKGHCL